MSGPAGRVVRLESTDDACGWEELLAGAPGATAFHRWDWLDLQERLQGCRIERLLILSGDVPIGVFPMPRRSPRSLTAARLPFPYLGPVVPVESIGDSLRALRTWQRRNRVVIARFELSPTAFAATPLTALPLRKYHSQLESTVSVDLSHGSLETLRSSFSSLRRRDIRRARRDGADVRPARPGEVAALLPLVLDEAFGAHSTTSPYPADVGEEIERWATGRGDVGTFTVFVDGEPAGVQVVIGAGSTSYAWAGASLRRFRDTNPNVLLYEALLAWSIRQGYASADLCGRVDEGVLRYKLAFGGTEQPYVAVESLLLGGLNDLIRNQVRRTRSA